MVSIENLPKHLNSQMFFLLKKIIIKEKLCAIFAYNSRIVINLIGGHG
jgi:hypothetical protein